MALSSTQCIQNDLGDLLQVKMGHETGVYVYKKLENTVATIERLISVFQ